MNGLDAACKSNISFAIFKIYLFAAPAFQKGMKLPGSRPDILRTKSLSGPSPVGGAFGGTESLNVMTLDDFELQAAHYNMACAHARLGNLDDVSPFVYGPFGKDCCIDE
jgi:hypothetical protein